MANVVKMSWQETNPKLLAATIKDQSLAKSVGIVDGTLNPEAFTDALKNFQVTVPLTEDFTFEVKTSYQEASAAIGGGSVVNLLQTAFNVQNLVGGGVSKLQQQFDLPVWQKTDPIRFDFEALFYTKTNAIRDVLAPCLSLLSISTLKKNPITGRFRAPGVNFANLRAIQQTPQAVNPATNTLVPNIPNVITVVIPGVIRLEGCIIETAKPTISKEKTDTNAPLWIKMAMTIRTAYPANDATLLNEYLANNLAGGLVRKNLYSIKDPLINLFR